MATCLRLLNVLVSIEKEAAACWFTYSRRFYNFPPTYSVFVPSFLTLSLILASNHEFLAALLRHSEACSQLACSVLWGYTLYLFFNFIHKGRLYGLGKYSVAITVHVPRGSWATLLFWMFPFKSRLTMYQMPFSSTRALFKLLALNHKIIKPH